MKKNMGKDKEKGEKVEKDDDMPMKKGMKGMPMKGMKSNRKY